MPTISLPAVRIHYERAGSGPALLQLGGTGGDLRRPPSPLEWPGAERFDQVVLDHRGLGRSRPADPGSQPTMVDFAADALGVADALGWERFALIGISFGGMIAQEVAIRAPKRVRRLVLACTSSGGAGGASAPLHEILALPGADATARMVELMDLRCGEDPALAAALASRVAALVDRAEGAPLAAGLARQLEARRHHDTWERLGGIEAPTLVAAGRFDGLAPLANSRALAGAIRGARLEIFEGGHVFLHQDPRAWPALAAFLAAPDAAGAAPAVSA